MHICISIATILQPATTALVWFQIAWQIWRTTVAPSGDQGVASSQLQ